jgi:uncharacterized protein YecE (DUF72 family)
MDKSKPPANSPPKGVRAWTTWPYRLGCPVWACKQWPNSVYPEKTRADSYLDWYSRCFPTVEGNSTFYSVPPIRTWEKWCDQVDAGFRFCFKFPRLISHDLQLIGCQEPLKNWLNALEILAKRSRLGPTFLQLAPSFSSRQLDSLAQFLQSLPHDWPWAVEVRHPDWFDGSPWGQRLDELLATYSIDRVLFDSRPLNSMQAHDATESASQRRKPKLPLCVSVTGKRPMVRLIGRNDVTEVSTYWDEWANRIADWIAEGLEPWVFTHAPDDAFAPELARALHQRIIDRSPSIEPLPAWSDLMPPTDPSSNALPRDKGPVQLRLF